MAKKRMEEQPQKKPQQPQAEQQTQPAAEVPAGAIQEEEKARRAEDVVEEMRRQREAKAMQTGSAGAMLPKAAEGQEARVGMIGRIGREDVHRAEQLLAQYKRGKTNLEERIKQNEQWFKLRNWENIGKSKNSADPQPVSAWLFNSIVNKHADAMDNIPEPNVLPRERSDEQTARVLAKVIPTILDNCDFEEVYSNAWWYKLKTGTGVYGIFWDSEKDNGLGDIDVRELDILNLFWQPGITDIQKSANLFHVELLDREAVEANWPEMKDKLGSTTIDVKKYHYDDTVDDTEKVAVVDWYYKTKTETGKRALHYVKFCGGEVLYASENDPAYAERGYYDHGRYPVVFDVLFPMAGSPCGFGYVDVCRSPQMFIDKLDQAMLKNAVMQARPRFFSRDDGNVNEQEYADLSKDFIHFAGSSNPADSIMQVPVPVMGNYAMAMRAAKIDELKETSGNRDFQQGGTSQGITAASAISALQEAGSKTSRDMIKSSYRAQAKICYFCIDLIRQFYTEPRTVRITGEMGMPQYERISAQMVGGQPQGAEFGTDMGERVPVFDIKVSAQKASPFATVAQNERAKELYGMGFFKPDLADQALGALDMMQFDGIEKVRERIMRNGAMMQKLQQMGQIAMAMAQQLDMEHGTQYTPQIAQIMGMQMQAGAPMGTGQGDVGVNALGDTFAKSRNQTAAAARNDAANKSTPR